ncbi:lish motif-containing protein [Atractiella rhizophila]|nr:lish motif-containing protein [Atractiella rhizophila]
MTSSRAPEVYINVDEWEEKLSMVNVSKSDLNQLIMDYLIIEGYPKAAKNFAREAKMDSPVDIEGIERRVDIQKAARAGKIEDAMKMCNDLSTEILDQNPTLYFHLRLQQIIEQIRTRDILNSLTFARTYLAPLGESNPSFLPQLELAMSLLAFPTHTSLPPQLQQLLSPAQRLQTALELNKAILEWQRYGKETKLPHLIRLASWGENLLEERLITFPRLEVGRVERFKASVKDHEMTEGEGMET